MDEAIARVVREEMARLNPRRKRLLDVEETAEYLGVSEAQITNLVALGKLIPCRIDSRRRFDIDDIDGLIMKSKEGES